MIYSCSMFFSEFQLLDLKIAEQMDHIGKMIIVEAERTHSNKPKDVLLHKHPSYKHSKLERLLVKAKEFQPIPSYNEAYQRDVAMRNKKINDDDIIISCDIDEIIPAHDFPEIIDKIRKFEYVRFGMQLYYYKINLLMGTWRSPIGVTGKFFKESGKTLTQLRHAKKGRVIQTQGKHFSYLLNPKDIETKLQSFVHCKMGKNIDLKHIKKKVASGEDLFKRGDRKGKVVAIDKNYPKTIINNLDKWKDWVLEFHN